MLTLSLDGMMELERHEQVMLKTQSSLNLATWTGDAWVGTQSLRDFSCFDARWNYIISSICFVICCLFGLRTTSLGFLCFFCFTIRRLYSCRLGVYFFIFKILCYFLSFTVYTLVGQGLSFFFASDFIVRSLYSCEPGGFFICDFAVHSLYSCELGVWLSFYE